MRCFCGALNLKTSFENPNLAQVHYTRMLREFCSRQRLNRHDDCCRMISVFGRIQQNDADREISAVAVLEDATVFAIIEVALAFAPRKNLFTFWDHGLLDLLALH